MAVYMRDGKGRMCKGGKVGNWYYDFQIEGKRYRKFLPTAQNKKQALIAEAKAKSDLFDAKYRQNVPRVSFDSFVENEFLPWAKLHKKSWRQDQYYAEGVLIVFFRAKALSEITPALIQQFKRQRVEGITRRGSHRNESTVNRELALLSKILNYAITLGHIETNPCSRVSRFTTVNNGKDRVVTPDEEARILSALITDDPNTEKLKRLVPVVLLALYVGMRRGEIFNLQWRDVDFQENLLRLRAGTTKSNRGRNLPLIGRLRDEMLALKERANAEASAHVFPFSKEFAGQQFAQLCTDLGLKGVTLHTLRHTFATRLADAGVHPYIARDLLGHREISMTSYYSHTLPAGMRDAVEKLEKEC